MGKGRIIATIGGMIILCGGGIALIPTELAMTQTETELGELKYPKPQFNYFERDLILKPGENSFEKQSWILEDVKIFLNPNPSNVPVLILIETEDRKIHYSSQSIGEFRDSFTVIPGKHYFVTVTNIGNESVYFVNFEFDNPKFNEENLSSPSSLVMIGFYIVITGLVIVAGGVVVAVKRGEK